MVVYFRLLSPVQLARVAALTVATNKLDTLALAKCAPPTPALTQTLTATLTTSVVLAILAHV